MIPTPLGILAAMPVEGQAIEHALADAITQKVLGRLVVSGLLDGHQVLLAHAGVGKVNAALSVVALADAGAAGIVLVGVAGGLADVRVGDAVVATDLIQHDVDIQALGDQPGYISDVPAGGASDPNLGDRLAAAALAIGATVHRGRIASGDQFIASPSKSQEIAQQFGAIAVEMEGAAAAQACGQLGLPLAVLRWISDAADDHATTDFPAFLQHVAELDLAVVRTLVR